MTTSSDEEPTPQSQGTVIVDAEDHTARPAAGESDPVGAAASTNARHAAPPLWRLTRAGAVLPWLVLAGFVLVLAVRIGPALVGVKVLAGTDILMAISPWRDGGKVIQPHIWYVGDSNDAFFPAYINLHHRLWAGQVPWWNSLPGPGDRLFAIGTYPTLSPVSWPWMIFPPSWASGFSKFLQLLAAFFGMVLWLRRLNLPIIAGGIAGLLYVGSGFLSSWSAWSAQSAVACMIPALFWSLERLIRMKTLRSALVPPLIVAFLMFGNFPAVAGHALYAAGAYVLVRILGGKDWADWRSRLKVLGYALGGLALGLAISALQLLPLLEKLSDTDLAYRSAAFRAQQPFKSFLSLIYPQVMNEAGYPKSNPIEAYAYVGATAMVLALIALLAGRYAGTPRGVTLFLAIGALLAAAVVWKQGWWTAWLGDLPIMSGNNSGRLRGIVDLLLCALAGVGVAVVMRYSTIPVLRRRIIAGGALAATALVSVGTVIVLVRYAEKPTTSALVTDAILAIGGAALVTAALLVTAARLKAILMALLIATVTAQSLISMNYFYPLSDKDTFFPDLDVITSLEQQSGDDRMVSLGGFPGSTASAYGLRSATGHLFYPVSWTELLMTLDPEAFTKRATSPTNPSLDIDIQAGGMRNPLLDRLSVSAVYLPASKEIPGRLTNPDGATAEANPGGTRVVDITTSGTSVELKRTPLRGVRLRIGAPTDAGGADLSLQAVVSDSATGAELANGIVTREVYRKGNLIDIPLPLEVLPPGDAPLTLTLTASSPRADLDPVITLASVRLPNPSVRVIASADDGLRMAYGDEHGSVWSRPTVLPRVRWASSSMVVPATGERLTALVDPATPRDTVVLSSAAPAADGKPASVTVVQDDGQTVSAVVQAEGAGFLVLADGIQDGFVATVDGQVADIYDADQAFGAVHVPAGRHLVEITYAPTGLRNGLVITGAALAGWSLLLLGTWLVPYLGGVRTGRRKRSAERPDDSAQLDGR